MDIDELDTIVYNCHVLRNALKLNDCSDAIEEGFNNADVALDWALDNLEDFVCDIDRKSNLLLDIFNFLLKYNWEKDNDFPEIFKRIQEEIIEAIEDDEEEQLVDLEEVTDKDIVLDDTEEIEEEKFNDGVDQDYEEYVERFLGYNPEEFSAL